MSIIYICVYLSTLFATRVVKVMTLCIVLWEGFWGATPTLPFFMLCSRFEHLYVLLLYIYYVVMCRLNGALNGATKGSSLSRTSPAVILNVATVHSAAKLEEREEET